MLINSVSDALEAYSRLTSIVDMTKYTYQTGYSRSSNIHAYGNYANTAQSSLQLLALMITMNKSLEELQQYVDKSCSYVYSFTSWAGSQSESISA